MTGTDRHNDDYVFERSYRASARLDLQHYHWRETLGHLIHPDIPMHGENLQIMDIGCGTGIWLTEVSRKLPASAILVGTDVSLDQCPPRTWLPSNVSLQVCNIFEEPPDDLLDRFDMVHLQLLNLVIKDQDITSVLRHVMKTVKKGGWIQWAEYDQPSNTIVKADSGASSLNFEALLKRVLKGATSPNWVADLTNQFRKQGLVSIQKFSYVPPFDHMPSTTNAVLMGLEEIVANMDQESAMQAKELLSGAAVEVRNGVAWRQPRLEVIGQMPQ